LEILVYLILLSVLFVAGAAAVFIWAVNNGQFERLERHGFDVLDDDGGEPKQ
jgi:cbb3-type cytochrome oxidase maturation protein